MRIANNLNPNINALLIDIVTSNPYSIFFGSLRDVSKLDTHHIHICVDPSLDPRTFNLRTASQVAAIWHKNDEVVEYREDDILSKNIKVETSRLDYLRVNQKEIRTDVYQGIVDSITTRESKASTIGRRIILLGSFIGGPRDLRKRYIDAMTLVQRFGKPDIFLTMTCNPSWSEIKAELLPNEEPQNRPDLLVRRGHKLDSPEKFDDFISVELPDKEKFPYLYSMVVKHMMHSPCGSLNCNNICMKNGLCKNHYPRDFISMTTMKVDGYPNYRRHNNNETVKVRGHMLDNRWVVPYNPYLLAKFDCHINVEICSTIKVVKYLYNST
ncbi:uncharacterized protein LOC114308332 [Camellia sinensis]|uniref:uncharacterized protein LOC114308332 n=1 Tax=Camellia sinensis TaxID=4442 RepID=UPI00103682C6|nr:uncharacterized protein LOC114308332 [Camellia sinensis]